MKRPYLPTETNFAFQKFSFSTLSRISKKVNVIYIIKHETTFLSIFIIIRKKGIDHEKLFKICYLQIGMPFVPRPSISDESSQKEISAEIETVGIVQQHRNRIVFESDSPKPSDNFVISKSTIMN